MEKNLYLETAGRFIEIAMDEIVRTAPNAEFDREKKLTDEEKEAIMEAVERQQPEGKEFAGIQVRHMEPKDGREKPNLAINIINRDEEGRLDVTTAFANVSEKNGVEQYKPSIKDTVPLEESKSSKSLARNAELYQVKQPHLVEGMIKDMIKKSEEIDVSKALSEKHRENLEKMKAQGKELKEIMSDVGHVNMKEMLRSDMFRKMLNENLELFMNAEKIAAEKAAVEISKKLPEKAKDKTASFNIREHMNNDEIAKLDNMPEKAREAVEGHINKSIPAKDVDKDDMFALSISDETEGKFVVYVLEDKNQANQILAMTVDNGEIEKGGNLPYQKGWKEYSEQMKAKNAEIIAGVGAIDKTLEKDEIKALQQIVKEEITQPVKSSVKGDEGKQLSRKDIDDTAVFNAHLEGKMAELQALLRNAEVNGFDEKSVACVKDCVEGINHEIKAVNINQGKNDEKLQTSAEKTSHSFEKIREYIHENANTVKRFGARTLDAIGDECRVAIARHMTNRETRASLDDESVRQKARRFYAVEYSAAALDIAKADKEISRIEAKYAKKLMQKNNSFFNRLRGKTFSLKDVMPPEKFNEIQSLQKVISARQIDMERIKDAYNKSLDFSRERLSEIKELRQEVGLEDRSLDRKVDKRLDAVNRDKGLDGERNSQNRDDDMERER